MNLENWKNRCNKLHEKLTQMGVDTGNSLNIIQGRYTTLRDIMALETELIETLLMCKCYPPQEITMRPGEDKPDIQCGNRCYESKRIINAKAEQWLYSQLSILQQAALKDGYVKQFEIKDWYLPYDPKISPKGKHKLSGGIVKGSVELLMNINPYQQMIARSILNKVRKVKRGAIPIIDVRYSPISNYHKLAKAIRNNLSKKTHIVFLMVNENLPDVTRRDVLFPIRNNGEVDKDVEEILEELRHVITYRPTNFTGYYTNYLHVKPTSSGLWHVLGWSADGDLLLNDKEVGRSLIANKPGMIMGILKGNTKRLSSIRFNCGGKKYEYDF